MYNLKKTVKFSYKNYKWLKYCNW